MFQRKYGVKHLALLAMVFAYGSKEMAVRRVTVLSPNVERRLTPKIRLLFLVQPHDQSTVLYMQGAGSRQEYVGFFVRILILDNNMVKCAGIRDIEFLALRQPEINPNQSRCIIHSHRTG